MNPVKALPSQKEEAIIDAYFEQGPIATRSKEVTFFSADARKSYQVYKVAVQMGAITAGGLVEVSVCATGAFFGGMIGGVLSVPGSALAGPAAPGVLPPAFTLGMLKGATLGSMIVTPLATWLAFKTGGVILTNRSYTVENLYENSNIREYNDYVLPILQKCLDEEEIACCPITYFPIVIPAKTPCGHLYELSAITEAIFKNQQLQLAEYEQKHAGEANLATLVKKFTYKPFPCPMCRSDVTFSSLKIGPEQFKEVHRQYKKKFDDLRKKIHTDKLNQVQLRITSKKESPELQDAVSEREGKICKADLELSEGFEIAEGNIRKANNHLFRLEASNFLRTSEENDLDPADTLKGYTSLAQQYSLKGE